MQILEFCSSKRIWQKLKKFGWQGARNVGTKIYTIKSLKCLTRNIKRTQGSKEEITFL